MSDGDWDEVEALNKEICRILTRFGKAARDGRGIRLTAAEVQTLHLTETGQAAAMCLHDSEEGVEGE